MARRQRRSTIAGDLGRLWDLQLQTARLGMNWFAMSVGAAQVIAARTMLMGAAAGQPVRLADPELALMVTEKAAAMGEAAERLSRHAMRGFGGRRVAHDATGIAAATVDAATAALSPFHRRVRANVRRLGKSG